MRVYMIYKGLLRAPSGYVRPCLVISSTCGVMLQGLCSQGSLGDIVAANHSLMTVLGFSET